MSTRIPPDTYKVFDNVVHQLRMYHVAIHAASLDMATHELVRRDSYRWFHEHVKNPNYIDTYDAYSDSYIYKFYGYMTDENWTFYKMKWP